jgi:hypothetical protein
MIFHSDCWKEIGVCFKGQSKFPFSIQEKKNPNIYVYEKQKTLIYDNRLEKTTLGN